jgi:hypothetical protein
LKSNRRSSRLLLTTAALAVLAVLALPSAPALATCDPIDPAVCMQPFPNDFFTVPDLTTETGLRVNFDTLDMPRNRANKPIDPIGYNHNDGFSPGAKIVTKVPGLDNIIAFHKTRAVPITDIARYADRNQPIVLLNADTGQRHPIWSEIDANPANPDDVNLIIRPAVNLDESGHYIVALRNLKNSAGRIIRAGEGFRTYRDKLASSDPTVTQARRTHFEQIFRTLKRAGIRRNELFLAWDFTVASERNLSERELSIRDDAFSQLGDANLSDLTVQGSAPNFVVTATCTDAGCQRQPTPELGCSSAAGDYTRIARCVEGRFTVPCYLNAIGCPSGSQFAYAPGSDVPVRIPGNTYAANFICQIPRSAIPAGGPVVPARPSLYGHGLLGDASEVEAGNVEAMSDEHNFVFCATDWIGLSIGDAPNVLSLLQDLSGFPSLADRAQQGYLDFMYLGRLMIHPNGFASDPAFQQNGQSVIDPSRLFYDGNSQGGIMGGGLTAVAPDFNRAVLGVPGMNYSILLRRSVDFDQYAEGSFEGSPDTDAGLYDNYPNELERPLILSLIQMLWDRGEADGYAHHMTSDPYPNTPAHTVLLHEALGDHQVANVATEVEARTIGADVHQPALDPRRSWDVLPYWGIPAIPSYPFNGSALVVWDSGRGQTGTPPTTNTPPRPELGYGNDPHSHPRSTVAARTQKSDFLQMGGQVVDVCGGLPCHTDAFNPGPPFFNGP